MKKLFLITLCVVLALSLVACGGNKEPVTDPTDPSGSQESTQSTLEGDPTTEGKDTPTEGDPTTEGDDPVTEGKDPTTEGKDTPTEGKDPTTEGDDPTTEGKDPTKDNTTTGGKDTTATKTTTEVVSDPTSGKTETTKPTKTEDTKPTATKTTGTVATATNNIVDWEQLFGTDPTTTTTTKKGETTTTTTTASTTTTTVPPTEVDKVLLPAVGTDVDVVKQKGRIRISEIDLKDGKLSVTIKNEDTNWITEETDYVRYACYDKNGKELKGTDDYFGYFYLGCLEVGEEEKFTVNLPAGTVEVKLVDSKIVYWTEWS